MLAKVKEQLFEMFDQAALETVQISLLMTSFYLYNSRPNLAFAILGSAIKSAQAIGLHQESLWRPCSQITRETRRRVWWATYVFDRSVQHQSAFPHCGYLPNTVLLLLCMADHALSMILIAT
jgi:hypothetical protein